jgi:hypothetical protein
MAFTSIEVGLEKGIGKDFPRLCEALARRVSPFEMCQSRCREFLFPFSAQGSVSGVRKMATNTIDRWESSETAPQPILGASRIILAVLMMGSGLRFWPHC